MLRSYLSNQKGMALAMVLVIVVVLSILGIAILEVAVADTKHAARDEKLMQAYYLAKSGVEATAKWMMTPGNNGASLINLTSPETVLDSGVAGKFTVEVKEEPNRIRITGTGIVDGVKNKAILILNKAGTSTGGPFDSMISATNNINYTGSSSLDGGDIEAGNNITHFGSATFTHGAAHHPVPINAPPIVFPADPSSATPMPYVGNSSSIFNLNISTDADKMVVASTFSQNNGTLTINTGSVAGDIVRLVVKDLNLANGTFDIEGEGTLHLFVTNSAIIKSDHVNPSKTAEKLVVFLADGITLNLEGNDSVNMCIYGPGAQINLAGCNGFNGAIVGEDVNCSGTTDITYALTAGTIDFDDFPVFYYVRGPWENP